MVLEARPKPCIELLERVHPAALISNHQLAQLSFRRLIFESHG